MKLNKKLTSILVTGAMIASIGGTTAMTSFAADYQENPVVTITKQLNIAKGLSAPDEDFTFKVTPVKVDNISYNNDNMPAINDVTIAYNGETATDGDILRNGVIDFSDVDWQHAGVYVYEINEKDGGNKAISYDGNKYTISIRVANGENGPEVKDIVVSKTDKDGNVTKVDANTDVDPENPNENINDPTGENDVVEQSGLLFANTYTKVADGTPTGVTEEDYPEVDPENPDPTKPTPDATPESASFVVTKEVTGTYGDKTKQFHFALALDYADTNVTNPIVKYYKVDKEKNITIADPTDFTLADGEKLIVEGAPVGTTYAVTENLATDEAAKKYVGTPTVTENGADAVYAKATASAEAGQDAKVEGALVTEGTNRADYVNVDKVDDDQTTPTGILMQNAPYILVATLAAGGLVIYLAKRREEEEEA